MPMPETASGARAVVRRYLDAIAAQDWATAGDCLCHDVRRIGPFGDVYQGREQYLAFLSHLMPTLAGYRMEIERVLTAGTGGTVLAQLAETVEMDGRAVVTPESLIFELDGHDAIREIRIYIQQLS